MHTHITIGEASRRYGVSLDTLRRWGRSGRVRCWRDSRGRRLFDPDEVARVVAPVGEPSPGPEPAIQAMRETPDEEARS